MTTSTSVKILRGSLHAAFAIMAIAAFSAGAQAAESNEITVQGSTAKTVGIDFATGAPIQETTVKVAVSYDPTTLTTDSGVALLKESVVDAARKACDMDDPLNDDDDDGACVRKAIRSAQAQIAQAVTQARSSTNG
jgi:UrcA family protein